jgi:hypothetical protein
VTGKKTLGGRLWTWIRIALIVALAIQAGYYAWQAHVEDRTLRTELLSRIPAGASPGERILDSMDLSFHLPPHRGVHVDYHLLNPLMKLMRPSALNVYRHGGHCAKRSRLLTVLLESQGIKAHKLFLYNPRGLVLLNDPPRAWVHVVVEAQLDGRWVVVDPLFHLVFPKPDGELATAADLRKHPDLLLAGRERADERYDTWEDSLYTYQDVRRFPWFMIPVAGEAAYAVLATVAGKARADAIVTPLWMEKPQEAIVIISLVLIALIVLTFVPWRRRGRSGKPR